MTKRKLFFHMITASLIRRRSRMLIALLSIAVGATILSGLVTIYYDVPQQMGAQFRNYGANMILTPTGDDISMDDANKAIGVIKDEDLVGAATYRYESVRIHEQPIMIAGVNMDQAQKTAPYWSVDGEWPSASGEIMIGYNVAESLGLKVGDTVEVTYTPETTDTADGTTSDEDLIDNYIDFKITSILSTGGSEEEYVYVSLEDLEQLTGQPTTVDVAELSVSAESDELNAYVDKINSKCDTVSAKLVKRVTASETTVLSKLQALVLLVTVVVLALTMICVATTMTAVVTERRKEIGLRKAIGASDKSIIAEFMGETILLGGIGGLLGAILGFAFAQYVSVSVFSSSISFRPALLPITIIVSMAVTAIACIIPIRSATAVDPALVLKGE